MGNFDLGTRLLPEIEFHRRRERERERDRFQLHSFLPSLSPPPPSFIQRLSFASPLLIKDNRVTFDVGPRFLFFFLHVPTVHKDIERQMVERRRCGGAV